MSRKTSQKRIEANRLNAQKSTGPRTDAGKAKSATNATTHGLSSVKQNPLEPGSFLSTEDQAAFQGLLDEYLATYNPQQRDEYDLVTEAVFAKWRQQRLWIAETNQLEVAIALNEADLQKALPLANANAHLANAIAKSESVLKLYLRYDAQFRRHYRQCLNDLRDLQASRLPPDDSPIEPNHPPNRPLRNPNRPHRPPHPPQLQTNPSASAPKPPMPSPKKPKSAASWISTSAGNLDASLGAVHRPRDQHFPTALPRESRWWRPEGLELLEQLQVD